MTAPSIALTAAEAETIARAHGALNWVGADTFPWPGEGGTAIEDCAGSVREALEDYAGLTTGAIHPATLFPDLGYGQDNAMETALDLVTQDIRDCTRELEALARAAEDAAYVSSAREEEVA